MIKNHIDELAIFGGPPTFKETLHVGRPNIGNRKIFFDRINDMLDRRWLTNRGPFVRELEECLADYFNVKHCIVMCNGTVALAIAIRALGLSGEVIVPSFTFIATAHALQWQEVTPVFCDVDPLTHNINPNKVEQMITPLTSGIIGVHVWGRPCDILSLEKIAAKHNLNLLFDAAHAFGNSYKGQMIGNFGLAEVFSFHATKIFNSFEGGAITTNNDKLANKIRLMQNFGFESMDKVIYIGTNGKMSEISAAMGLTSLESVDEFMEVNRQNYNHYHSSFLDLPGVQLVTFNETERNNYNYIVTEINAQESGIHRDQIVHILHAERVRARRYFFPACHRMEPYASYFPHAGLLLPITEHLVQRTMSLPTGTCMNKDRIDQVTGLLRFIIKNGSKITDRLNRLHNIS